MFRRILVPFDGSSYALRALTVALDLAKAADGTVTAEERSVAPAWPCTNGRTTGLSPAHPRLQLHKPGMEGPGRSGSARSSFDPGFREELMLSGGATIMPGCCRRHDPPVCFGRSAGVLAPCRRRPGSHDL
ncbi:MAG: universal stress protein [Firmicutes bacterium]|nr:universal stress protein [Bacillota bacterium]